MAGSLPIFKCFAFLLILYNTTNNIILANTNLIFITAFGTSYFLIEYLKLKLTE